ncbi:metalloregulator ArsR/SmtB family transcription factor [Longispora sp. K20-0274]|uniref:ArsR/SmtB family transcription factor n=1 Tax=Longispora sp. K20-0274 TaxID=3088255 RepID=UPI00399B0C22
MGDRAHKDDLYGGFARAAKALGNPKRLELVDLLAQGERSVDALASAAGLSVTLTSAHLQTLRAAGLLASRRDGTKVYYRLAGPDVAALYALLRTVAAAHSPDVAHAAAVYLGTDDVDEIDRDSLTARVAAGAVVLDVRPAVEYAAGHIPGAVNIPVEELADRLAELPADAEIVAYCRGAYCVLAHDAARLLAARGRPVARLSDGMLEWNLAGLPVQTAAA